MEFTEEELEIITRTVGCFISDYETRASNFEKEKALYKKLTERLRNERRRTA